MSGMLSKNGHGEPMGARVCLEAAHLFEYLAEQGRILPYSGTVEMLRELARQIESSAQKESE